MFTQRSAPSEYESLDFFRGWSQTDLRRLTRVAEVVEYEPGELVAVEGRVARDFHVIVTGRAAVIEGDRHLRDIGAGETIGEEALLTGAAIPAAVIAQTYLKALLLGQREFHGLLFEAPSLGRRLALQLAGRLADLPATA